MGMTVNTNVQAINAQRNLAVSAMKMSKAMERLSSGLRINRAADDAAGLAISEKLISQVKGLTQASRNSQDGISMVQTAEGALNETHSILQRMRELSVQAGNTTLSTADRDAIGDELLALRNEIDRIGNATKFNGQALLNGSLVTTQDAASTAKVGVAIDTNSVASVDVSKAMAGRTYTLSYVGATDTLTLTRSGDNVAQSLVTTAIDTSGAGVKSYNFDQLGVSFTLVGPAQSAVDAIGGALNAKTIITAAGSGSATFQVGAEVGQTITVSFADMRAAALGTGVVGGGDELSDVVFDNQAVSTTAKADTLRTIIDNAIGDVSTQRGTLGAVQNRMEHTVASLGVAVENLAASNARIREADIAEESSNLTTQQILQQAGTAVLAQANTAPQSVLALLRG